MVHEVNKTQQAHKETIEAFLNFNKILSTSNSVTIKPKIKNLVKQCIEISKEDWDSFETSYDFTESPLLKYKGLPLKNAIDNYIAYRDKQHEKLKKNHNPKKKTTLKKKQIKNRK